MENIVDKDKKTFTTWCSHCRKNVIDLYDHMKIFHSNSITIMNSCNKCKLSFTDTETLKIHMNDVHEGVQHKCNYCGIYFSHSGRLFNHIKIVHPNNAICYQKLTIL